jgi:hypothetical protein
LKFKNLLSAYSLFMVTIGCETILTNEKEVKAVNPPHFIKTSLERKDVPDVVEADYESTVELKKQNLSHLSYRILGANSKELTQTFPGDYTNVEGVLTFRGNHFRNSASFGHIPSNPSQLNIKWTFHTSSSPKWGGGAGWTGQPAIINWDKNVRKIMNLKEPFKNKEEFVETIYASLDGHIYFFDLETGEQSRPPINIHNPIKGSVSLDPRGYPLLYVGQGIPLTGNENIGFRIYSLIDGSLLHFIKGTDPFAFRKWGAFDSAPIINKETDTMYLGGENGILYSLQLNTLFDMDKGTISIQPEILKYRYKINENLHQGIESSVSAYKNIIFFADNGGSIQAIDTRSFTPIWALPPTDDTDATIVIESENDVPYLYTGTEVDKQGAKGNCLLRKLDGLSGDTIWERQIPAFSLLGKKPVNGGLLATPIIGKKEIYNLVIFTISRYKTFDGGLMIALDKKTGEEVWRWEMPHYAWSSPVDVYTKDKQAYIVQCDSAGNIYLIKGLTGEIINTYSSNKFNIEASPAIFNDVMIVANRGGEIRAFQIK